MSSLYRDKWIECTPDAIRIRAYYFPWGAKSVPYTSLRGVERVEMGLLSGQARIWGTSNPRYWAHLDPKRMGKRSGLVLNVGGFIRPFITPDDVPAVEAILRERAGLGPQDGAPGRVPLV